jgi:leucine efflux protein
MLGVTDGPGFVIAGIVSLAIPGPGNLALITGFRQAVAIKLLNPKANLFYFAFFPLLVEPAQHGGLATFAFMATKVAALTFVYTSTVALLGHRLRASPRIATALNRIAFTMLVGFGIELALLR